MTKGSKMFLILGAVVVIVGIAAFGSYNSLVGSQEGVKNKWADVQTQYQRRIDLIPNLMETVKGSAEFEQSTLQAVVEARSAWAKAASGTINEQVQAAGGFDSALSRLLVTVEAYPQLKSTEAYRDFMTQQEGTENRVAVSRRDFNDAVRGYNTLVRRFPSNIIAGIFGFQKMDSFKADEGAQKAPKVDFTK
ncbi:LemA family protein [Candidatus Uhrbacteria bacterium]|nr:LemA family protein [Candidatus Uhrbacteria bacterium]